MKHKKIKKRREYMVQINRIKEHSPQEGKNKWLILCSASIASSVPRSDWEGEEVLFF